MNNKKLHLLMILFILLLFGILLIGCTSSTPATTEPAPTASATMAAETQSPSTTEEPSSDSGNEGKVQDVAKVATDVSARTPIPTATPGFVAEKIDEFTQKTGLSDITILWLPVADWLNLGASLILVILGYYFGYWLLTVGIKWLFNRLNWQVDDNFLAKIEGELKWVIFLFALRFGILRLGFLSTTIRTIVDDVTYVLITILIGVAVLRSLDHLINYYEDTYIKKEDQPRLAPIVMIVRRIMDLIVIVLVVSIILSHFGVEINIISAAFLVIVGVIVYGARDVISDAISGLIILVDQPFRVGDSIEIEDVDTWGEVTDIGTRTTRILTSDNREIIIPNSQIGSGRIINYSFPDPSYQVSTVLGIAYGSDLGKIRKIIEETVHNVDGVMKDKPVIVQFTEFGGTTRTIKVLWWVKHRRYQNGSIDKVNEALETALTEAGVDMPYDTYNVNMSLDKDTYNVNVRMDEEPTKKKRSSKKGNTQEN